jgi:hypothetical protein
MLANSKNEESIQHAITITICDLVYEFENLVKKNWKIKK